MVGWSGAQSQSRPSCSWNQRCSSSTRKSACAPERARSASSSKKSPSWSLAAEAVAVMPSAKASHIAISPRVRASPVGYHSALSSYFAAR